MIFVREKSYVQTVLVQGWFMLSGMLDYRQLLLPFFDKPDSAYFSAAFTVTP